MTGVTTVAVPAGADRGSSEVGTDPAATRASPRWLERLALVAVAAAILPIVVATARAIGDDWVPVGENAYFELRARDVLTDHHPWLGSWTSASARVGVDMNNPGPLYFELLAAPVKLGDGAGLAVGVALINIAATIGIALVAGRAAGPRGVLAAMLAATGLVWAMGSEMLFDPWQPHSLMLPFLCLLMLVWALAAGDLVMLPWLAGLSTFLVQTHLGYAVIVPLLVVWGLVAAGVGVWRRRRDDPERWPETRRRLRRAAGLAAGVAVVGWSQTLYEQVFGPGWGNLGRLAEGARASQPRVGLADAPSFVANVAALPPWWGRPSFRDAFIILGPDPVPSRAGAIAALVAVLALLAGGAVLVDRRRGGRTTVHAARTAAVVLLVAVLGAATMPVGEGGVAPHHVRWLWPVAVFVTFGLALVVVDALGRGRSARLGAVALAAVVVGLSGLSLPAMNARGGEANNASAMPVIRELRPQLATLRDEQGVFFDTGALRFGESYAWPIMAELQELGVPFYLADGPMIRQAGPERTWPGEVSVRMYLREGRAARTAIPGAERVAYARAALPDRAAADLAAARDELASFVEDGGLQLADEPADEPDAEVPETSDLGSEPIELSESQLRDPDYLFGIGESPEQARPLVRLVQGDRLDVPDRWQRALERYVQLQVEADQLEVAVFVEPLEAS